MLQIEPIQQILAMHPEDRRRAIAAEWLELVEHGRLGGKVYVIDTETTGVSKNDGIIEICILDMRGTKVFHRFYNPMVPINPHALAVHNLTPKVLTANGAIDWTPEAVNDLIDVIDGGVLLEWSTGFDKRMVEQSCWAAGVTNVSDYCQWRNVMRDFDIYQGITNIKGTSLKMTKLVDAATECGYRVDAVKAHTATYDCQMVLAVMFAVTGMTLG